MKSMLSVASLIRIADDQDAVLCLDNLFKVQFFLVYTFVWMWVSAVKYYNNNLVLEFMNIACTIKCKYQSRWSYLIMKSVNFLLVGINERNRIQSNNKHIYRIHEKKTSNFKWKERKSGRKNQISQEIEFNKKTTWTNISQHKIDWKHIQIHISSRAQQK